MTDMIQNFLAKIDLQDSCIINYYPYLVYFICYPYVYIGQAELYVLQYVPLNYDEFVNL